MGITTFGPDQPLGFAMHHNRQFAQPAAVLWDNIDPNAYKRGKLIPVRTKWLLAFCRILFSMHQVCWDVVACECVQNVMGLGKGKGKGRGVRAHLPSPALHHRGLCQATARALMGGFT